MGRGLVPAPLAARERLALMEHDTSLSSWTLGLVRLGLATSNGSAANTDKKGPACQTSALPARTRQVASVVWLRTVDIFGGVPYQLLCELSGRLRPFSVSAGVASYGRRGGR